MSSSWGLGVQGFRVSGFNVDTVRAPGSSTGSR